MAFSFLPKGSTVTADELRIMYALQKKPGKMLISPDGGKAYLAVRNGLVCFMGPDFNRLGTEDSIKFIHQALHELMGFER